MAKKTEDIDMTELATQARRDRKAAQNATARRQAAANKASGVGRQHTQLGVNDGIKARSKRDRDRREALAVKRKDQRDKAATMVSQLLPDEGAARKVFTAVLAEFLTAEAKNVNGQRVGATEVAANKVRVKYAHLLRDDPTAFNAGVKAAKQALYRAANPDWEKADEAKRQARRTIPAKRPARRPHSDADIASLETALGAAQTNLRIAQAFNKRKVPVAMAELAAAKNALQVAQAANEKFDKAAKTAA